MQVKSVIGPTPVLKRQQIVTIIGPESVILHPGLGGLYGSLRNSLQSGEMLLLGFEKLLGVLCHR